MNSGKVTVLTPNGRRQIVKVAPSTTILQVLEEACAKHEFDPNSYGLTHHNRLMDMSLMFRYSGLPNNCLLEMQESTTKREEAEVTICLQLEDGNRVQGSFKASLFLKNVIEELCFDQLNFEVPPVIVYMHKEVYGDALDSTTLKSLGITSGRAMLRLIHKNPEELKLQANVYVPVTKKSKVDDEEDIPKRIAVEKTTPEQKTSVTEEEKMDTEDLETSKTGSKVEEVVDEKREEKKPEYDWGQGVRLASKKDDVVMEADDAEPNDSESVPEEEPEVIEIGERNAILYNMEDIKKVETDISDSFFELTVSDLQSLLEDLRKQREDMDNAPMLTKELRDIEEKTRTLNKLAQYKNTVIRVQFPNRLVLQGKFSPVEKIDTVYEFVRKFLDKADTKFHLFTTPPKKILPQELTLVEADYVPTVLLHFGVEDSSDNDQYLRAEFLSKITSAKGALHAASRLRGIKDSHTSNSNSTEEQQGPSKGAIPKRKPDNFKESSVTSQPDGNVPKWFRATGK